jgi:hypothetical protein
MPYLLISTQIRMVSSRRRGLWPTRLRPPLRASLGPGQRRGARDPQSALQGAGEAGAAGEGQVRASPPRGIGEPLRTRCAQCPPPSR